MFWAEETFFLGFWPFQGALGKFPHFWAFSNSGVRGAKFLTDGNCYFPAGGSFRRAREVHPRELNVLFRVLKSEEGPIDFTHG